MSETKPDTHSFTKTTALPRKINEIILMIDHVLIILQESIMLANCFASALNGLTVHV